MRFGLTLYLDPSQCLTCSVNIDKWILASSHDPAMVRITLIRQPTPDEDTLLILTRVKATGIIPQSARTRSTGTLVALKDTMLGHVTWYDPDEPDIANLLLGHLP